MMAGFRIREQRNITFAAGTHSKPIELSPGAVFSAYLPASFAGSSLGLQVEVKPDVWVDVVDPDAALPVPVQGGVCNVLPSVVYASAAGKVRLVSDASESFNDGILFVSR